MRRLSVAAVAAVAALSASVFAASWEKSGEFKPGEVLTAQEKKGNHHEVKGKVPVESYYYAFELHTEFGELKPVGLCLLRKRIRQDGCPVRRYIVHGNDGYRWRQPARATTAGR